MYRLPLLACLVALSLHTAASFSHTGWTQTSLPSSPTSFGRRHLLTTDSVGMRMTEESQPEAGAADDGVVGESSTGAADESQDEERGEDANNGGESDAAAKTEDPAVVALKEEIAALESSLKSKRSTLMYTKDQLEEYSKAGYARKVAEMENMRRIRSNMNSSGRSSATAAVLSEFLPVYDKMNDLKAKFGGDDFGSKYSGLSMENTFAKMGVKQFEVATGDPVDNSRMVVVEGTHSAEFDNNVVITPLSKGMEFEGNVIRVAECVASLGPEGAGEDGPEAGSADNQEGP